MGWPHLAKKNLHNHLNWHDERVVPIDEQDPDQALSWKNLRRQLWLSTMTSDTAYTIISLSNDRERSGQQFVSLDLGHCTSAWLTAVPTAPVWCDERKLVEVSGFMHQKPSWKHQLHGSNGHQRWFAFANKFNSHLYPVVTVCSCWRNQVSVFSTVTFVDISDPLRFISCAKSMIYESYESLIK